MNWMKLPGWPALALHELTHAAVALPYADVSLNYAAAVPYAELRWQPDTPQLAVRLAHLAPTLVGAILTVLAATLLGPVAMSMIPSNPFHALALALLAGYNWVLYIWPSESDRDPFGAGVEEATADG